MKCKACGEDKVRRFFLLDAQQKSVYKDDEGNIWHGKICYVCFKNYVKEHSGKRPLKVSQCKECEKEFMQKTIRQFTCSKQCYRAYVSKKP